MAFYFKSWSKSDPSDLATKTSVLSSSDWEKLTSGGAQKGNPEAAVSIVEFSDFECPACAAAQTSLKQVLTEDTDGVRLIYRHFPLEFHPLARPSALASFCAQEQNKFWEYHDLIFANQKDLSEQSLKKWAKDLSLDENQFNNCFSSNKYNSKLEEETALGRQMRISATPTFYVNGRMVVWQSRNEGWYQALKRYIETVKKPS